MASGVFVPGAAAVPSAPLGLAGGRLTKRGMVHRPLCDGCMKPSLPQSTHSQASHAAAHSSSSLPLAGGDSLHGSCGVSPAFWVRRRQVSTSLRMASSWMPGFGSGAASAFASHPGCNSGGDGHSISLGNRILRTDYGLPRRERVSITGLCVGTAVSLSTVQLVMSPAIPLPTRKKSKMLGSPHGRVASGFIGPDDLPVQGPW